MKMCTAHWAALRSEVDNQGLSAFVAATAQEAFDSAARDLKGEAGPVTDFDPLMGACMAIYAQYVQDIGLDALVGDKCPLCGVERDGPSSAANWIEGSVRDQRHYAEELGLLVKEREF